jgi:HlyD family secretion protein
MTRAIPKRVLPWALVAAIAAAAWFGWSSSRDKGPGEGFISGNGRIEATEINVATKLGGRVEQILVDEGAFVRAGEPLAVMQVDVLAAQRDQADAQYQQAVQSVTGARAQVAARVSDKATAQAVLAQRESDVATALAIVSQRKSDAVSAQALVIQRQAELDAAQRRLARSSTLSQEGASSIQELDDDRARVSSAEAALSAARAQVATAQAGIAASEAQVVTARAGVGAARAQVATADATIEAARTQVIEAQSTVDAARAAVARIKADIDDSTLVSPRDGRVQFRVAQPGEVLGAGGRVLNLVDLSDVYMTFFVPETAVGRVQLGSDARLILDAAPQYVIPARVSFVASTAQFTPKTVETASERQKLMFRVRAQIDRELLQKHIAFVKTGVPGVAWLRLDPRQPWPDELAVRVE